MSIAPQTLARTRNLASKTCELFWLNHVAEETRQILRACTDLAERNDEIEDGVLGQS